MYTPAAARPWSHVDEFAKPLFERREVLERAGRHVLRHLGVPHLDDVRRAAAGEGRVELLQVVAPRLVLDVDSDPGVLLLERSGRRVDDRLPLLRLRVGLQPDGDAVGRRAAGCGGRHRCEGDADEDDGADDACSDHGRFPQAHREAVRVARGSRVAKGEQTPEPPTGLYHSATIRNSRTVIAGCQDQLGQGEIVPVGTCKPISSEKERLLRRRHDCRKYAGTASLVLTNDQKRRSSVTSL